MCWHNVRVTREQSVSSFDEKAALAELERLRDSIQAARQARQRTSDEFDAFVKSFRKPTSTSSSDPPVAVVFEGSHVGVALQSAPDSATSAASEVAQRPASESINPPIQFPNPPSTVAIALNDDAAAERAVSPPRDKPRRQHRLNNRPLVIVGIVAVIALALLSTRWGTRVSPPAPVPAVKNSAVSTQSVARPTAAPPQTAPVGPVVHPVVLELRPLRPVWMRVVVDGQKTFEGTAQGEQPLRFGADQSIVVRVGNGGDVLVKTGSREESFGVAGQPLTRTFSKR